MTEEEDQEEMEGSCVVCGAIPEAGHEECPKCEEQLSEEIRRWT